MAIALHIISKPDPQTRQKYESTFAKLDELHARHPAGRLSHVSWTVGDELHVLDVWESRDQFEAFFLVLGPILGELGMELAGPPEIGEAIQVLVPDGVTAS